MASRKSTSAACMGMLFFVLYSVASLIPLSSQTGSQDGGQKSREQNLVVAFSETRIEWNPLHTYSATEAQLYTAIYEGLVSYDPVNLKPQAAVARDWKISDDRRTYTFTIRDDASFNDGTDLGAQVFKDSLIAVMTPSFECPFAGLLDPIEGAAEYRSGKGPASAVGIKVLGKKVLEITLNAPTSHFLQILCHQSMVPIHPKMLGLREWKPEQIIGNGPYRISKTQTDRIFLEKSPTYWNRQDLQLESIEMIFRDDPPSISDSFNSGEIHWVESGAELSKLDDPQSFQVSPQFSTTLLFFAEGSKVMANPDLRKAITMLLPLPQLRSRDLFNVPTSRLIPDIPFYPKADEPPAGSKKEALEMLAKAGFPNGQGLKIRVLFPESELFTEIGKLLEDSMNSLQIKFEITFAPAESYYNLMDKGDYEMASLSWVGDYADPMTFLDLYVSNSSLNQSGFSDPDYDKLILDAQKLEGKERYKLLSKAESLLLAKAQVIPLAHSPSVNIINLETVGGWYKNPLNVHPFRYLFLKSRKPPRNIAGL